MRKRINVLLGMPHDKRAHNVTLMDEFLAYQEYPILLLESLMTHCPWPVKGVLLLVAMLVAVMNWVVRVFIDFVSTIILSLEVFWCYVQDGMPLFAFVMIPMSFVLDFLPSVMLDMESCESVIKSIWQSACKKELVYEL